MVEEKRWRTGTPSTALEGTTSLQRGSWQLVHPVMSRCDVRFRGSHLLEMGLTHSFPWSSLPPSVAVVNPHLGALICSGPYVDGMYKKRGG